MKNFFFVLVFMLFAFSASQAQITLETTYTGGNYATSWLSVQKFGLTGDKYVLLDKTHKQFQIYSMNNVLEKTFSIPLFATPGNFTIDFISDNLFNTDSIIEYRLVDNSVSGSGKVYVLNEDSSIVFEQDSVDITGSILNYYFEGTFGFIYPTTTGTKMILHTLDTTWRVFDLPGNLPCYECSNGVYTGNFSPSGQGGEGMGISNPYPNPTDNLTRIDYQLPNGIKQGELVFYNTLGNEMKRFKVTSTFSFIYVSARDLPSGTYYYNLQTSAGASDGKKMVVIR